jgi:hypothetical protein
MTTDEYITLAGKYCERMEWNHDAIPELAECLEDHDKRMTSFLDGERIARQYAIDKGVEIQRENLRLRAALYVIGYNTEPPCLDDPADIAQTTLTQSANYSTFRPLPNVQAQR